MGAARAVVMGQKNYLFTGPDSCGQRAAALYSLIVPAKLNELDPVPYLPGKAPASILNSGPSKDR
jgi:transposase